MSVFFEPPRREERQEKTANRQGAKNAKNAKTDWCKTNPSSSSTFPFNARNISWRAWRLGGSSILLGGLGVLAVQSIFLGGLGALAVPFIFLAASAPWRFKRAAHKW